MFNIFFLSFDLTRDSLAIIRTLLYWTEWIGEANKMNRAQIFKYGNHAESRAKLKIHECESQTNIWSNSCPDSTDSLIHELIEENGRRKNAVKLIENGWSWTFAQLSKCVHAFFVHDHQASINHYIRIDASLYYSIFWPQQKRTKPFHFISYATNYGCIFFSFASVGEKYGWNRSLNNVFCLHSTFHPSFLHPSSKCGRIISHEKKENYIRI